MNIIPGAIPLSEDEFAQLRAWLYEAAGITLTDNKKVLVCSRLSKRLQELRLPSYRAYLALLTSAADKGEGQVAIDLMTTNETSFFREPVHFRFLTEQILPTVRAGRSFRVWSAACSSGEEPYTLAMVLAEALGEGPWEVLASDLSGRVLQAAAQGRYPMARAKDIPRPLLMKHCLRGVRTEEGYFVIGPQLRRRVRFQQVNLNSELPPLGRLDVIFLRNVLIYFDAAVKTQVLRRVLEPLRPAGYLLIGHSDSIMDTGHELTALAPSIYRKPPEKSARGS